MQTRREREGRERHWQLVLVVVGSRMAQQNDDDYDEVKRRVVSKE